ncbi:zf-HC2 domain-containing protein [Micromonospora sp. Llam7]|uniref:zf-HC2 domain-containing protein n=1 Tax=Micromonospora tarapacensis TaxID=2835305 RepID=UPI001C834DD8|nr:zf-HC2 domain-containing protein [Micromonospora tarapacensis]MBX7265052.1 zf-HC2 domain-containing protein [Micromonospora tarapacensis]
MRAGGDHTTAERERLTLYLLGALEDAERESFEDHLAGCWHCLDEAAAIGPSVGGLAGLGDADWSPPTAETPTPAPPAAENPVLSASVSAATDASDAAAATDGRPARDGNDDLGRASGPDGAAGTRERDAGDAETGPVRGAGSRPAGRRPSVGRPPSTAGSRRRRQARWVGAAAVVLALAGGAVAVNEWAAGPDAVLTASGEAPGYGASLSVAITVGDGGSATIRITATGLRQGLRYRLFAVTRDGATHVVRDWTASSGPQEVAGETSLPIDELSFITVGLVDGSAIVTAPIAQDPTPPR